MSYNKDKDVYMISVICAYIKSTGELASGTTSVTFDDFIKDKKHVQVLGTTGQWSPTLKAYLSENTEDTFIFLLQSSPLYVARDISELEYRYMYNVLKKELESESEYIEDIWYKVVREVNKTLLDTPETEDLFGDLLVSL